jgi:U4/U6.U5 tri-snRNP-associated protein 2
MEMHTTTKRKHGPTDDDVVSDGDAHKRLKEETVDASSSLAVVRRCPYLDTINRGLLDFDFEKVCSVSSTNVNVYACLTCGKYFQGAPPLPAAMDLVPEVRC